MKIRKPSAENCQGGILPNCSIDRCKALDQGCVTLTLNPLFIGDSQRELVRVLARLCTLLIHVQLFVLVY